LSLKLFQWFLESRFDRGKFFRYTQTRLVMKSHK